MPSVHRHAPFFFVSSAQISDGHVVVEGPDARHLCVVRRAKPKDRIQAGDGNGRIVEAAIETISEKQVRAAIVGEKKVARVLPEITVLQGLARQNKVDFALQKLAELGVDHIVVFGVSRSLPRWDEAKRVNMRRRWQKICYEASKQSQRAWLPRLDGPVDLAGAVEASRDLELCLVADPAAGTGLKGALPLARPASAGVVVGPEGGLEESEVERFSEAGGKPVSLGGQILRTETAGLALASVLMFHFGRLG